jgi:hypothetical protein
VAIKTDMVLNARLVESGGFEGLHPATLAQSVSTP